MTSSVSIIIVSYFTGPTLWLAISSALAQPECTEILLVNNGNIPGDEKHLRELEAKEPRLKIVEGQGNIGFGKACNLAASQAIGDYLLLLNPDSMLPGGAIAQLLAEIATYPENTLAGCFLQNPDGSEQRGGRRALLTPMNGIVESLGFNRISKKFENLNFNRLPMPENTHEVPVISGAFMCIAASFYKRLDGFDEDYFLHMEDTDFCYRVHKAGGKVICIPSVKVMHFRSTSEVASSFIEKQKAKGFILYLNKHFSEQKLLLSIMRIGIMVRCWLKIVIGTLNRAFVPPMTAKNEIARIALLYKLTQFSPQDNSLAGKTIIITGADSQIGMCVVGKALAKGAHVIATYKLTHVAFSHPNLTWRKINFSYKEDIAAFTEIKADVLIHAAKFELLEKISSKLTEQGITRVIAFDSEHIFKKPESLPEPEVNNIPDMTTLYPNICYGVGFGSSIARMADIIRRFGKLVIYKKGSGVRNPVNAQDIADAAIAIIDNPVTYRKTYNLGGDEFITYHDMLMKLFEYIGKPARLIKIPAFSAILSFLGIIYQLPDLNADIALRMNRDLISDNTAAAEDFSYNPRKFLEGDVVI